MRMKTVKIYIAIKKINRVLLLSVICSMFFMNGCGNQSKNQNISQDNKNNSEVTSMEKETKEFVTISQKEARKIIEEDEDVIILDVRTKDEFNTGHIKDAILIPYDKIRELATKDIPDLDSLVLVYCRSGSRSKIAAQELVKMGYTNIREFGGISSWEYETEK